MSKEISKNERVEALKELLIDIHNGKDFDQVQKKFRQNFSNVSAGEIAQAERELVQNHGFTHSDITLLCDHHAALFEGSVEEVSFMPQNSLAYSVIIEENIALAKLLEQEIMPLVDKLLQGDSQSTAKLTAALDKFSKISAHYVKKENIIFPYMEKHGITAPPKVMWAVDDEIRAKIKAAIAALKDNKSAEQTASLIKSAATQAKDMIVKENTILLPMISEVLTESEWKQIDQDFMQEELFLISLADIDAAPVEVKPEKAQIDGGQIKLPSGLLSELQLLGILNTLPIDITFVDKDDKVKYFSENAERIFPRSRSIIGRDVANCHPPASVHVVEDILNDFKSGKKDSEEFWINMRGKYIYIRYFAVRDEQNNYVGTLEVSQDIAPLQKISGEKRLMD